MYHPLPEPFPLHAECCRNLPYHRRSSGWTRSSLLYMVPGEYEMRDGEPDYTGRLCVIGTNIDEHKLEELFELN